MDSAPSQRRSITVAGAVVAGVLLALTGAVPVTSQVPTLEARRTTEAIPVTDPWSEVWDLAEQRSIRLSAQEIVAPFGGTVALLSARALHDGETIYLMLEWADGEQDESVAGAQEFTDGAALQFPTRDGTVPPYTMGGPADPVNIWHWKAVWQADLLGAEAPPAQLSTDLYPNADDPIYRPAAALGNLIAQTEHASPIENLVAQGFGSLTSSEVQDVLGAGEWRDGLWRVTFARDFDAAAPGLARFAVGKETMVAFAIWDGAVDERNGQKAIAQFINLRVTDAEAAGGVVEFADDREVGRPWMFVLALATAVALILGAAQWATRRREPE